MEAAKATDEAVSSPSSNKRPKTKDEDTVDKSPESGVDPEDPKDDEEAEKGMATNEFSLLLLF